MYFYVAEVKSVLLLSDSMCKYVQNIDWLEVKYISGAKIALLISFIRDNKACILKYTHIILHVGTNDVGNGVKVDTIISEYKRLLNSLLFSKSKIIISAVLPRPIDFSVTKEVVIAVNKSLKKLALKTNCTFVHTFRSFINQPGSVPVYRYFSSRDGLHLSRHGVSVVRQFFINVVNSLH